MARSRLFRGMVLGGGFGLVLGIGAVAMELIAAGSGPPGLSEDVIDNWLVGLLPGLVGAVAAWTGISALGREPPGLKLRCGLAGGAAGALVAGILAFALTALWLSVTRDEFEMARGAPFLSAMGLTPAGGVLGFLVGVASVWSVRPGNRKTLISSSAFRRK